MVFWIHEISTTLHQMRPFSMHAISGHCLNWNYSVFKGTVITRNPMIKFTVSQLWAYKCSSLFGTSGGKSTRECWISKDSVKPEALLHSHRRKGDKRVPSAVNAFLQQNVNRRSFSFLPVWTADPDRNHWPRTQLPSLSLGTTATLLTKINPGCSRTLLTCHFSKMWLKGRDEPRPWGWGHWCSEDCEPTAKSSSTEEEDSSHVNSRTGHVTDAEKQTLTGS